MTRPPRGDALNAVDDAPVRPRLRHRQGPAGLHSLQWRVEIGRIYETRGGPDNLRWFWSMPTPDDTIESGDDLGDASQFQKSWDAWKAWANLRSSQAPR